MKTIYLKCLEKFACIASACPSTCCSGWNILVDDESVERYREMIDPTLRNDILSHICIKNGQYYFENKKNGDCAMLDADGLCRIQRHTEEKMLCRTCRKYPRLAGNLESGVQCFSMAVSCPVVAEYIITGRVKWVAVENKVYRDLAIREDEELSIIRENLLWLKKYRKPSVEMVPFEKWHAEYQNLMLLSESIASCVKHYPECFQLLNWLSVYAGFHEEQGIRHLVAFYEKNQDALHLIQENYVKYRFLSLKAEEGMDDLTLAKQVFGELSLLVLLGNGMMEEEKKLSSEEWNKILCAMYRFTAHGNKRKSDVKKIFSIFMKENNYII